MCNWDDRYEYDPRDAAEEAAHLATCDGSPKWGQASGRCDHIAHFTGTGTYRVGCDAD